MDEALSFDEPIEGETNKAFEYFQEYLKMGINRSFQAVANKYQISINAIKKYADKFFWTERIRLYNNHIATTYRKEMEEEARKTNKRHIKQAKILLDKSMKRLEKMEGDTLTPDQALKFMELSVKMERNALGIDDLPKQETNVEVNNNLNIDYSDEDIKRIEKNLYTGDEHSEVSGNKGEGE